MGRLPASSDARKSVGRGHGLLVGPQIIFWAWFTSGRKREAQPKRNISKSSDSQFAFPSLQFAAATCKHLQATERFKPHKKTERFKISCQVLEGPWTETFQNFVTTSTRYMVCCLLQVQCDIFCVCSRFFFKASWIHQKPALVLSDRSTVKDQSSEFIQVEDQSVSLTPNH